MFAKSYKIDIGHESVAPATDLYTFCRIQEILSTTVEHLHFQSANGKQAVLDDVSRAIREAYRLPEDKRRKVVKRLFLQWNPNRNPGNKTFCSQVFQHIRREIQKMEGEDKNVKDRTLHGGKGTGRRTLDTMEKRRGSFRPACAKRILNLERQTLVPTG